MRISFWFLASLTVSGCYLSHERAASAIPMGDSGALVRDAGPPDSRPMMVDTGLPDSGFPDAGFDGLVVSLSPETPAGATIPRNASGARLVTFDFTEGSMTGTITGLAIHRIGVGATSDFSNVYLFDALTGARLTTGHSINSTTNIVMFNGLSVTVSPGFTRSLILVGDVDALTSGGQHAFEIVDVSAVLATGTEVSGAFPVRGNVMTIGTIEAGRIVSLQGDDLPEATSGTDAAVSNFWLATDDHDIDVRRVTLLQSGSILNSDLSRLELYMGSALVAATLALSRDQMVFQFPAGLVIPARSTLNFTVRAHVEGPAGRTIRTYIEYTADVEAIDMVYGTPAYVELGSFDGTIPANTSVVTTR